MDDSNFQKQASLADSRGRMPAYTTLLVNISAPLKQRPALSLASRDRRTECRFFVLLDLQCATLLSRWILQVWAARNSGCSEQSASPTGPAAQADSAPRMPARRHLRHLAPALTSLRAAVGRHPGKTRSGNS